MAKFSREPTFTPHDARVAAVEASTPVREVPPPIRPAYVEPPGGESWTYEGAPGFAREPRWELFLLAVSNMVGEATFYEPAAARDARYAALVSAVAAADPEWMAAFLGWLRAEGNMRSASVVGAAEALRAQLTAGIPGGRRIVGSVLQRADEPGELLAYWTSRHGRALPKPLKRGIADVVARLYTERALLKYDTAAHPFRFADVLELVHATPATAHQSALFRHALDRRHRTRPDAATGQPDASTATRGGSADGSAAPGAPACDELDALGLRTLAANARLRARALTDPAALLDPAAVAAAGMTWEDVLSLAGSGIDRAQLWASVISSMGYMALLRNLRNFDDAGVGDDVAATVAAKLADPAEVARSRQFPFRFLAAHQQVTSGRWSAALESALAASLRHLPALGGRSLILVDTSASMSSLALSARSRITPVMAGALFGVALAARGESVDLYGFADGTFRHEVDPAAPVLPEVTRFVARTGEVGHGTMIADAVRATFDGQDRVFIVTDMQTMDAGTTTAATEDVPIYGFNLGGYRPAAFRAGPHRHEFGGLTDATFRMVPLLERGHAGHWPWLTG